MLSTDERIIDKMKEANFPMEAAYLFGRLVTAYLNRTFYRDDAKRVMLGLESIKEQHRRTRCDDDVAYRIQTEEREEAEIKATAAVRTKVSADKYAKKIRYAFVEEFPQFEFALEWLGIQPSSVGKTPETK